MCMSAYYANTYWTIVVGIVTGKHILCSLYSLLLGREIILIFMFVVFRMCAIGSHSKNLSDKRNIMDAHGFYCLHQIIRVPNIYDHAFLLFT